MKPHYDLSNKYLIGLWVKVFDFYKIRRKFEEGYCIYVNTYMYKPLPLKTKEILNVEPECHKKDIEKATSLICTFLKSVYKL